MLALLAAFLTLEAQDTIVEMPNDEQNNVEEEILVNEEKSSCLTVAELIGLVHTQLDSIQDILYDHGYRRGYYSNKEQNYDTVGEVVLKYGIRAAFDHIKDKNSVIWIYVSSEGLGNIVEVEKTGCEFYNELQAELDFKRDRINRTFCGSFISHGVVQQYMDNIDGYRINYEEDEATQSLNLIIRDTTEITNYVNAKKEARRQHVQNLVDMSVGMAARHQYIPALGILDSMIDIGILDAIVTGTRVKLAEDAEKYYFARLEFFANTTMQYDSSMLICDTLLMVSKKEDSVSAIHKTLMSQFNGSVVPYSQVCHDDFADVVSQLEQLINLETRSRSEDIRYRLKFEFTFHTDTANASFGHIDLLQGLTVLPETSELQARIDEISRSPHIYPVLENGVYILTHQELDADISWRYRTYRIVDTCNESTQWLRPYIQEIESKYFRMGQSQSLPTKRIYNFGVKEKVNQGKTYTDVELVSFSYPGPFSWMPSLIIPGLGTKLQGSSSSVGGRLVPFLICGAFAVGGLAYEDYAIKHNIQRYGLSEEFEHLYQIKYFGYIVGGIGGVLAMSIYIDELVDGISTSIKNHKRAERLSKDLRNGPKNLHSEDIRL